MRLFPPILLLPLVFALGSDNAPPMVRPVLGPATPVATMAVPLDSSDPARVALGPLRFLGGWRLENDDPAFGSFSSMIADGSALTLLNDAGGFVQLRIDARGRTSDIRFGDLPGGPGGAGQKRNRDSEAMTRDERTGRIWVGFETRDAVFRYAPDLSRVEAGVRPKAMRKWPGNGGAEAMVRLRSGRFLVFSERGKGPPGAMEALIFDRDPTDPAARVTRFFYRPPDDFLVTDVAELPDGRLLLLHRRIWLWPVLSAKLSLLDPRTIRADEVAMGEEIATLAPPLAVDNMEALAVTSEGGRTIIWIASDDNFGTPFQKNLLLKFAWEPRG